ncbi:ArnT family glycosyltransferase [Mycolicibacterium arenosum]|uniref:Glycosyltransferase family 39 protein n=1 Tax=Mycolicibacterium arenosum TaxID=2952157 RepID=A0ABT1M740_9MYCO|nr:glycosyltransferase family 39 protein [Mycolicibacterium sp. CAU 1645]MCP9274670.1 glycosyltransferase family 39 protein [Mycolicibacterium sp. CAU 1645]
MTTPLGTRDIEDQPPPTAPLAVPPDAGAGSRWRPAYLVVLLFATAVLYLWNITINGMGNQFYAAAAQAGSRSWKALLFGSLDAQNFITVDKPPLSQWVMGLSGRLFGFSSASMLVPEAVMAVGAVALLYAAVARLGGRWAGLLAGAALALTPVAVLMFRFNNPDAAMVLLMTAAAYCTVRALQSHGGRWMALAGGAVGLAFLAKMLEGVMVAPALAAAYLLAAPVSMRRRWLHLAGSAAAFVASAGWFVVLTLLWPASARPYLAGSTDDNFMNLVLGYNGFARVLGHNHPGALDVQANPFPSKMLGSPTPTFLRLVSGEFGYEIGWLLPTALVAAVLVVLARGRAPRTDPARAGAVLFGGWLVVDALVLTLMHGMVHPYYSLSIAPPIAALVALGGHELWAHRESVWYRAAFAAVVASTGVFGWWILSRNAHWLPELRWAIPAVTVVAAALLVLSGRALRGRTAGAVLGLAVAGVLAGPAAYSLATVDVAHRGGGPSVGPVLAGHETHGLWNLSVESPELDAVLEGTTTEWSAAIDRSANAASLELATGTSVMAIGGFTGTDPTPTLQQFQSDVAAHRVGYYVSSVQSGHEPGWNGRTHADIARWVAATFPARHVGKATVYDLSTPLSAT